MQRRELAVAVRSAAGSGRSRLGLVPVACAPRVPPLPELRRRPVVRGSGETAPVAASSLAAPASAVGRAGALADLPDGLRKLIIGCAFVLSLVFAACAGVVVATALSGPVETRTAVVLSGQSLWDIAQDTGASDVAEAVAQIRELNGLEDSVVYPGQSLLVPVS